MYIIISILTFILIIFLLFRFRPDSSYEVLDCYLDNQNFENIQIKHDYFIPKGHPIRSRIGKGCEIYSFNIYDKDKKETRSGWACIGTNTVFTDELNLKFDDCDEVINISSDDMSQMVKLRKEIKKT